MKGVIYYYGIISTVKKAWDKKNQEIWGLFSGIPPRELSLCKPKDQVLDFKITAAFY